MWNPNFGWTSGLAFLVLTCGVANAGDDGLTKALRGVTTAASYHFTVRDGLTGSPVEATYQKGVPLYCSADKIEFFRKGTLMLYKQGDVWQRTRTGTLSDPLRILGASSKVRALQMPHEELATLAKALTNIKKVEVKGQTVVDAEFAADVAKKLARTEDRDLARGGTARLWLDKDGRLTKYEIAIRLQGVRGNADVDGVVTRTVTLSGLGTTKVELPAAAKKALE